MDTGYRISMKSNEPKKDNLRLALILASVVAVFFLGFIGKMVFFGG